MNRILAARICQSKGHYGESKKKIQRYTNKTLQHVPNHEKVTQKVDLHRLFMAIGTPLGIGQAGLVDAGITDQTIDGFGATPLLQPLTEFSHRIEGVELAVHGGESIERPVVNLGHGIHLVNVTNGTNDVITVGSQEGLGRLPAKT